MDKVMTQADAAGKIGLCERQVRRLVARIREEGDRGIIHRLRGKPSNSAMPETVKNKVLQLFKDKYPDFGPTLASEKILERDKIKINDETLRCWLIERNIPYKKRRKRPHRQWRERKAHHGEMIQFDGSAHDWFEGRGESCVLLGYIDDASNHRYSRFYEYEGVIPALDSLKRYICKNGIPYSIYLDKHPTYKSTAKPTIADELNNRKALSQVERAAEELGILVIHADSAQAKGRIERDFRTYQDRLIKEMRLRNISTIKGANKFLPEFLTKHNKRFKVAPAGEGNFHRPVPKGMDLAAILCVRTERVLRNDFTISFEGRLYQILDRTGAKTVVVEKRLNGLLFITYKGQKLRYKVIPQRVSPPVPQEPRKVRSIYRPPRAHPWKKALFDKRLALEAIKQQTNQSDKREGELVLMKT
jgi:transposase